MPYLLLVAAAVTAVAAYTDLRRGEIPNWLTFGGFLAGLVASAALAARTGELSRVGASVAGAFVGSLLCAVIPLYLWRNGAMGGGEVKLFMALGSLCHPLTGLDIELTAFIAGSLLAPVKLAFDGQLIATMKRTGMLVANVFLPKNRHYELPRAALVWFRFGPAIFLATLWVAIAEWRHP